MHNLRPGPHWWRALAAIVAVAAWARLCQLGTFSLKLDEVFTMSRSVLPIPDLLSASMADGDNPPLYLLITHASLRLGLEEPWLRLVPIVAGLASILVWAHWTRTHFGARIGLLVASLMALLTFHIRYSQELRAYPYLLLITGISMILVDRVRSQPNIGNGLALAVSFAGGMYTHLSYAALLIPVAGVVLGGTEPDESTGSNQRRVIATLIGSLIVGGMAFAPWCIRIIGTVQAKISRGTSALTWTALESKWEFLTVAAAQYDPPSLTGRTLAVLFLVGLMVAARERMGRAALIPAVLAAVATEAVLQFIERWSQPRYFTPLWPFMVILMGLGLDRVARSVPSHWARRGLYAALGVALLLHVDGYHRRGRPHWDRMAAAIEEIRRPGERVLVEGQWAGNAVDYYLDGPVDHLRWNTDPLMSYLRTEPSVLFVSSTHRATNSALRWIARRGVLVAEIPQTGQLRRIRRDMLRPWLVDDEVTWPEPAIELVSSRLEAPVEGCRMRLRPRKHAPANVSPVSRINLSQATDDVLRGGWSNPTSLWNSTPVRWVIGKEAAVIVTRTDITPASVAVRLKSPRKLSDSQELRVVVNGHVLGTVRVAVRPSTYRFEASAPVWISGENLLLLQFKRTIEPAEEVWSPRAAAVAWIEISPA